MITKFKIFENISNDDKKKYQYLYDLVYTTIKKYNYIINGFDFYSDFSGSFQWENKYYYFFATPYWGGESEIPIDIYDENSDEIESDIVHIDKLKTEKDVDDVVEIYYNTIKRITNDLNKRQEYIEELIKLPNIDNIDIELKDMTYDSLEIDKEDGLNGIKFSNFTNSEIFEIYNQIKTEYPEYFSSIKYNL